MVTASPLDRPRWWQAGAVVTLASLVCNLAILAIGGRLISIDEQFTPLQVGPVVFLTVVDVVGATAVYACLYSRVGRPHRVYVAVALIALLLSLAPDFALTQVALTGDPSHSIPQATWAEAALLMVMHVATAALCITLTPSWPPLRPGTRTQA